MGDSWPLSPFSASPPTTSCFKPPPFPRAPSKSLESASRRGSPAGTLHDHRRPSPDCSVTNSTTFSHPPAPSSYAALRIRGPLFKDHPRHHPNLLLPPSSNGTGRGESSSLLYPPPGSPGEHHITVRVEEADDSGPRTSVRTLTRPATLMRFSGHLVPPLSMVTTPHSADLTPYSSDGSSVAALYHPVSLFIPARPPPVSCGTRSDLPSPIPQPFTLLPFCLLSKFTLVSLSLCPCVVGHFLSTQMP